MDDNCKIFIGIKLEEKMKKAVSIIMAVLICATLIPGLDMDAYQANAAKKVRHGIVKSGKHYYLYTPSGKLVKKTKRVNGVNYFISSGKKHYVRARVYKKKYYYANGRQMTSADKLDFQTIIRAEKIVKRITKKSWGKMRKLKKCFRWVMAFPYKTRRVFKFKQKNWPAVYANDHFVRKGGECHADGAAFAYLAAACGYTKVYACCDSRINGENNHGFAEVNGRAFDPLFAQAKSFSRNWNARYGVYELSPAAKIKIPYGKASHNKKGKMIPAKTAPYKESKVKELKIEKWSSKEKKLYYNDGTVVKGTVVWKGKFYAFNKKGKYRETFTKNLRSAAKEGEDIAKLKKLLGEPIKKDYSNNCEIGGDDGIWKYDGFTVFTHRPDEGTETFVSAE